MFDMRRRILQFAQPSLVLSAVLLSEVVKLCEVLKYFLKHTVDQLIERNGSRPLLEVYSSDCTPLRVKTVHKASWELLHVLRSGRSSLEWLQQRYWLKSASGESAVYFVDPRLMADKTAWSHHAAYVDLLPMARTKHKGLVFNHHVYDRAVCSACARIQWQRHVAYDEFLRNEAQDEDLIELRLRLSMFTSVGCMAHDLHGSLRWAMAEFFDDKAAQRGMWIVFESVKNAYDILVLALPGWLGRVLAFRDCDDVRALEDFVDVDGSRA